MLTSSCSSSTTVPAGSWNHERRAALENPPCPSQSSDLTCGLLWWLLRGPESFSLDDKFVAQFRDRGMTEKSLAQLSALKGQPFDRAGFWSAIPPIVRGDDQGHTNGPKVRAIA